MPFIQAGIGYRNYQSGKSPLEAPSGTSGANSVEDGYAERAKFRDVGELAYAEVHQAQLMRICPREEPVQDGDNESGSLLTAEIMGGKQRDHRSDDDRRNPMAEAPIVRTRLAHHVNYTGDIDAAGIRIPAGRCN